MTARVIYEGDLRSTAIHTSSGSKIETDAPLDNHGKGARFSPTDLVAVALATCIVTTLGIACPSHNVDITGAVCDVEKIMQSDPRRIGEIKVHMTFPGHAPYTDREMKVIERIAHACPVFQSLHPDCKKTLTFDWPV